ncbi:MAG: hypothetical protein KAS99_00455 [Candidatus Omnitrophica bacterium]|nr:hypothetical protein [Candidatus Omnitrophota bacterium]
MKKTYDILLIYGFSRLHPYYLNIIKYLAKGKNIGVCVLDTNKYIVSADSKRIDKLQNTENAFMEFCKELGADLIYPDEEIKAGNELIANILFVPQIKLSMDGLELIKNSIKYNNIIGIQTFGYGKNLLDDLFSMGCRKFFVYDRNIFTKVIQSEKREDLLDKFEIIEMGAPYRKYPLWPENEIAEIDYLIALPTLVFLKNPKKRYDLVKNIYNLLGKLNQDDKVAIKLHNVKDGGNKYLKETHFRFVPLGIFSAKFLGRRGYDLASAIFYKNILDRAEALQNITPYFNFGLELFLPYVKKGVITGISTVLWHCLYNKIAVYNCDNQPFGEDLPNYPGYKNFYIPYCEGRIPFDEQYYDKISDSAKKADLIELIKEEL